MISEIWKRKGRLFKLVAVALAVIPAGYVFFYLITSDQNSVLLFDVFSPTIGLLVILYYSLLFVLGVVWLIRQTLSIYGLRNEQTKIELLHLQSQVSPHFFFNMLNNLYGLVDKDPEKSKALILKLSDLMRYNIYEGERPLVSLGEEVEYLSNYIELHGMRYHKEIDIQFEVELEDKALQIMPLLFIILTENAFKHGVERLRENAYVHIKLSSKNKRIDFEIENNFDETQVQEEKGIGLKNLQRRLELAYRRKHTLSISNQDSVHKAHLQLQTW